jgi:hypothetical protein
VTPLRLGRGVIWTKDRINQLTTVEVRQLRANAERLQEAEITAWCDEILGARPKTGGRPGKRRRAA